MVRSPIAGKEDELLFFSVEMAQEVIRQSGAKDVIVARVEISEKHLPVAYDADEKVVAKVNNRGQWTAIQIETGPTIITNEAEMPDWVKKNRTNIRVEYRPDSQPATYYTTDASKEKFLDQTRLDKKGVQVALAFYPLAEFVRYGNGITMSQVCQNTTVKA